MHNISNNEENFERRLRAYLYAQSKQLDAETEKHLAQCRQRALTTVKESSLRVRGAEFLTMLMQPVWLATAASVIALVAIAIALSSNGSVKSVTPPQAHIEQQQQKSEFGDVIDEDVELMLEKEQWDLIRSWEFYAWAADNDELG